MEAEIHYRFMSLSWARRIQSTVSFSLLRIYKVVKIWPGLFVCKQVTVCPGHIWTTSYFNIIFPCTPRYSKWSLLFRFPHRIVVCIYCPRKRTACWVRHIVACEKCKPWSSCSRTPSACVPWLVWEIKLHTRIAGTQAVWAACFWLQILLVRA